MFYFFRAVCGDGVSGIIAVCVDSVEGSDGVSGTTGVGCDDSTTGVDVVDVDVVDVRGVVSGVVSGGVVNGVSNVGCAVSVNLMFKPLRLLV